MSNEMKQLKNNSIEVPLEMFIHYDKTIIDRLYADCDPQNSLSYEDYLNLPTPEQYINRLEKEKKNSNETEKINATDDKSKDKA